MVRRGLLVVGFLVVVVGAFVVVVVGMVVVGMVAGTLVEVGGCGPVLNTPRSANTAFDSFLPKADSVRLGSRPKRFRTVAYTERKSTVGIMASK